MSTFSEDRQQLKEDILYLEYLIQVEKDDIKKRISSQIDRNSSLEKQVEGISDELSAVLAQFSARILIIEKVLNNTCTEGNGQKLLSENTTLEVSRKKLEKELKISIEDVGFQNRLGYLNHTSDNIPYHSLSEGSEINIEIYADRTITQALAVDIAEVSDSKLLNQVVFEIDGHKLKHRVIEIEGRPRLICYLPKSETGNSTFVRIQIPKKDSSQPFKFHMSDIHCVPKKGVMQIIKNLFKKV